VNAFRKATGHLPPLQLIVGQFAGYKIPTEDLPARKRETVEEAGARLMGGLMSMGR
jgi:hypothetical protein